MAPARLASNGKSMKEANNVCNGHGLLQSLLLPARLVSSNKEVVLIWLEVHSNFLRLVKDGGRGRGVREWAWGGGGIDIPNATLSPPERFCMEMVTAE